MKSSLLPQSTGTTNRNEEISGEPIYHPHENDILLGRGGNNNKHIGNEQLRVMALDRVHKYMKCTKTQKTRMVHELVASMKNLDPPARFLRRNSSGEWFEASNKFAKEKVSQVFRDALAKIASGHPDPDDSIEKLMLQFSSSSTSAHSKTANSSHPPMGRFNSLFRNRKVRTSTLMDFSDIFSPLESLPEASSQPFVVQSSLRTIEDNRQCEVSAGRSSSLQELQKIGGSYRVGAHSIGTESTISYEPITLHRYLNEGDNGSIKHHFALPKANQNFLSTSQTESCTLDSTQEGAFSTNNDECDFDITYSRHKIVDMNLDPDENYNLADISTDEISDLFMDEELTLDFLGTNLLLL
jgi:hypothetical protein